LPPEKTGAHVACGDDEVTLVTRVCDNSGLEESFCDLAEIGVTFVTCVGLIPGSRHRDFLCRDNRGTITALLSRRRM
jgi:hypothetical protein